MQTLVGGVSAALSGALLTVFASIVGRDAATVGGRQARRGRTVYNISAKAMLFTLRTNQRKRWRLSPRLHWLYRANHGGTDSAGQHSAWRLCDAGFEQHELARAVGQQTLVAG
jgi:hypothetical protein